MSKLSVTLLFVGLSLLVVCNGSPLPRESSESNESNESLEDIREQCIENTGSDADFPKFMASVEQAMLCLAGFDSKNFINDIRHLSNATRATFFPKYCPKIRSLVSCIDGSLLGMQPCLDEDVFKIAEALIESIPDAVDLACKNDGEIFLKLEDEEHQECIMENTVQLSECVETLSTNFDNAIELFELTQDQCRELVIFRECIKEQLDPCDLSDIVSIYDIPMNAILPLTPCANYTQTPMVHLLDKNSVGED
uniref:Putative secreted protein n=1 Tax=Anopheles darlingi TaxID=43151 RepID=A0A2M4D190_ANODA